MAKPIGDPPAQRPDRPRPPPSPPADGRFRLGLRLGEATVAVDPPAPGGRPVEPAAVRAALRDWPFDALDESALERATREGTGQPVAVGRIEVAPTPSDRTPFAIKITAGRRAAYLLPWASCPAEIADPSPVVALLRVAGVRHGVDQAALGALIDQPLDRPVLLARATLPGPGEDGAIEPLVELIPFDPREPEPEVYPPVCPGDPLLRRVPPAAGRAGVDVTGHPIPGPPGEAASLLDLVGPGTELAPGGDAVVATGNGRAMFRDVPSEEPPGGTASRIVVVPDAALRREARQSADGSFELRCERGQVRLVVDAPAENGQRVLTQDVFRALAGWPLGRADVAVIDAAVAAADSLPSLVGEIVPTAEPAPTDPYAITYLPERGLVYLFPWAAHRAPPIDAAATRENLAREGIVYGLDDEALGKLAAAPWSRPTAVARLGERRYRTRTIEEAIKQATVETRMPPERLEATVERTEKGGFLGIGLPWLEVVVRPTLAPLPARVPEPGRLESRCAAGELQVRAVAPRNGGARLSGEAIRARLAPWDLPPSSHELIEATARRCTGEWVTIGRLSPTGPKGVPIGAPDGAKVIVRVSRDGQVARLYPWSNVPVEATKDEILGALKLAGVSRGIDAAAVERAAAAPLAAPVGVAMGTPPIPGTDARITYVVPQLRLGQNDEDERAAGPRTVGDAATPRRERVDFREWFRDPSVQVGTVLATKTALVPAQSGHTVWGDLQLAPEPRDVDLRAMAGVGTRVDEDGLTLRATVEGMPAVVGRRVTVQPVQVIHGDVDYKVGNVTFKGSVVVDGDVYPGFRVRAEAQIVIRGSAEAATLDSDADVLVGEGIIGQGKGTVRAGGSVQARLIDAAEVEAGDSVLVDTEIVNAAVSARGWVRVGGRIAGGQVRARSGIVAHVIGSPSGWRTHVQIGWTEDANEPSDKAPAQAAILKPGAPLRLRGRRLGETTSPARTPGITVRQAVYPDVQLTIHGTTLKIESRSGAGTYRKDEGEIRLFPT